MTLKFAILSKKVRAVLERDVISVIAIINKISNPRKIARKILPLIKKEVEFEPKLESVAKIVERYVNEVEKTGKIGVYDINAIQNLMTKTRLALQNDIAIIVVRIIKNIGSVLTKVIQVAYSEIEKPFINITFGHAYVTIMINQSELEKVIRIIGNKNIIYKKKNQVAISVITPSNVVNVPGYTSYILSLLAMSGINIIELLSSYVEGTIITNEKDAQQAYAILRSEIEKLRQYFV